jgi:TAP-like protein
VLILAGERDTRTPVADARAVAASFPQSTLVVVKGAGHSVLFGTACGARSVIAWISGSEPKRCAPAAPGLAPLGPFPQGAAPSTHAGALAAAIATMREALAAALATQGLDRKVDGLAGGTLTPSRGATGTVRLYGYSDAPGVALTGLLNFGMFASGLLWDAHVEVRGAPAATGSLVFNGRKVTGTIGGRPVSEALAS